MKSKGKCVFQSVTKVLFVTTQIAALSWVTLSYLIALYATVKLGQPYPIEGLSTQAIITVLGVNTLKVVENIFEHNDSKVFGNSDSKGKSNSDDVEI